jgi:glycosyltransferase involved in cell wall biosynthesis
LAPSATASEGILSSMVRFSILMPVYNRERYVRQAVDSVLSQTFTDYELFAVDDGSTDRSAEILRSYGDKIKFLQQPNRGPEAARNSAAALARGEYLVFLDSDDFFFPFALETFDKVIRHFNNPPLVLGAYCFDQEQLSPPPSTPIEAFEFENFGSKTRAVGTSCIIVRKGAFDAVGGQRKDTTATTWDADDTNLLLKLSSYRPCIVIKRPATTWYRLHDENSIKNLTGVVNGLLRVAAAERRGEYAGGTNTRAYIGGRAASFAYRICWRGGQRKLALRLVKSTASMVVEALWNNGKRYFQKPTKAIVLPE